MSNPSLSLPPMLIEQYVRVPSPLRGHALLAYHTFQKQELPRGRMMHRACEAHVNGELSFFDLC